MANFYMSNKNWNTLQNYARHAYNEYKSEIGGFLIAEQDEDNKWKIHKPVILKQEISAGNTVLDKDALADYYVKTAIKMKDKPFQFVWWHSHHTMAVFWSGTDLTAIDEFSNGNMSISLVINLKEEYKLRVNLWHPYKMHEDVDMDIIGLPKDKLVPKTIRNSVDSLCEEPPTVKYVYNQYRQPVNILHNKKPKSQMAIWMDTAVDDTTDLEMIQVEAKIDDILCDYVTTLNYNQYVADVKKLNRDLRDKLSELRCGLVELKHEPFLFTAMSTFPSDEWIHPKGEQWSFIDKAIEYQLECDNDYGYGGINANSTL